MKDKSLLKLGSVCAVLLGIAKIVSAVLYLVLPADLRAEVAGKIFLPAFFANPTPLLSFFWVEAAVGILGIALVPALSSLVKTKNEGWVSWSSNLALIGYAVSTTGYLLSIARLPLIATTFVNAPETQSVLAATWKASIDLFGFWGYAAIGFWILIVSLLAVRFSVMPRWLAVLGLILSIPHLLIPFGTLLKSQPLLIGIAVVGLALPVWYIGVGWFLNKKAAEA
jgi:hypothetical protein